MSWELGEDLLAALVDGDGADANRELDRVVAGPGGVERSVLVALGCAFLRTPESARQHAHWVEDPTLRGVVSALVEHVVSDRRALWSAVSAIAMDSQGARVAAARLLAEPEACQLTEDELHALAAQLGMPAALLESTLTLLAQRGRSSDESVPEEMGVATPTAEASTMASAAEQAWSDVAEHGRYRLLASVERARLDEIAELFGCSEPRFESLMAAVVPLRQLEGVLSPPPAASDGLTSWLLGAPRSAWEACELPRREALVQAANDREVERLKRRLQEELPPQQRGAVSRVRRDLLWGYAGEPEPLVDALDFSTVRRLGRHFGFPPTRDGVIEWLRGEAGESPKSPKTKAAVPPRLAPHGSGWVRWCARRARPALPARPRDLVQFIQEQRSQGVSSDEVRRVLEELGQEHLARGAASPVDNEWVQRELGLEPSSPPDTNTALPAPDEALDDAVQTEDVASATGATGAVEPSTPEDHQEFVEEAVETTEETPVAAAPDALSASQEVEREHASAGSALHTTEDLPEAVAPVELQETPPASDARSTERGSVVEPERSERQSSVGGDLAAAHAHLVHRLATLRDEREGRRVFLIEHGWDEPTLELLLDTLRETLEVHALLEESFWSLRRLPLLVIATEVGYRYQGTGSDFWPVLTDRLGVELTDSDQRLLRDWFVQAVELTGVEPVPSAWSDQYSRIAWPISHAVLPRELHAPLLAAASEVGWSSSSVQLLSSWAEYRGLQRLSAFLSDEELARAVLASLVEGEASWLAPEFASRVEADVEGERVARVARGRARLRMGSLAKPTTAVADQEAEAPALLRLDIDNKDLIVVVPPLDVSRELGAQRLDFLGTGRSVPARHLRSGKELALRGLQLHADGRVPVFPASELKPRVLVDLTAPLVFQRDDEGHPAQVSADQPLRGRDAWVLLAGQPGVKPPSGVAMMGEVCGRWAYTLDLDSTEARDWAKAIGLSAQSGVRVRWLGMPRLSLAGPRQHAPGDVVVWEVSTGGGRTLYAAKVGSDTSVVELPGLGEQARSIQVRVQEETPAPAALEASLQGSVSTNGLVRGAVSLRVAGPPGASAPARLVLHRGSTRVAESRLSIHSLPAVISGTHPAWSPIQAALMEQLQAGVRLTLEIGTLYRREWWLEPELTSVRWDSLAGEARASSDGGLLGVGFASGVHPLLARQREAAGEGVELLQPLGPSGRAMLGGGLVRSSKSTLSFELPRRPARLAGRWVGSGSAVGLKAVLQSYLAWGSAHGEDMWSEGLRRKVEGQLCAWLTEQLCGARWQQEEQGLAVSAEIPGLGQLLADSVEREVGWSDSYTQDLLPPLSDPGVRRGLLAAIAVRLDAQADVLLDTGIEDSTIEQVAADVFEAAVRDVAAHLSQIPGEETDEPELDPDLECDFEALALCVRRTCRRYTAVHGLGDLVLLVQPRGAFEQVRHSLLSGAGEERVTQDLVAWANSRKGTGSRWSDEEVRALIDMWGLRLEGETSDVVASAAQKALADQGVARASRLVSLWRSRGVSP